MPQFNLVVESTPELSPERLREICELTASVWPPKGDPPPSIDERVEKYLGDKTRPFQRAIMVYGGASLVGHARVFDRRIAAGSRTVDNLALAGVCVRPEYRGSGLGAILARAAFGFIDDGRFECSVFQTQVPGFYEKLGCREIGNVFVNSRDEEKPNERPWWDPHVMLYPAGFDIGDEVIDLCGPGY